jgi:hypothetical protein
LGQSFLNQGLLCRYGGAGLWDDQGLRQVSGEARASYGTGETQILGCDGTAQPCLLWSQGRLVPFQGLSQGHPLRGWILCLTEIAISGWFSHPKSIAIRKSVRIHDFKLMP